MLGLMQNQPLLISSLITFAERNHGDGEIVSRRVEGDIHRYTYRTWPAARASSPMPWMRMGVPFSDRVASWPGTATATWRCTLVSPARAVCCTINPACTPDQMAWIINHAEDQVLCFDMTFLPLVQAVHAKCPGQMGGAVRRRQTARGHGHSQPDSYEAWIGARLQRLSPGPRSTKTRLQHVLHQRHHGQPQGRLYSHRSTTLHPMRQRCPM